MSREQSPKIRAGDRAACGEVRSSPRIDAVTEPTNQSKNKHIKHIPAPDGVAPGAGYTQVVTGTGRLVAVSGQVALDQYGNVVGPGDAAVQALQVFENLHRCLASAGATFSDVVKLTFFVTDVAHLPAVRKARDQYVDVENPPASTAVQVAALFRPELVLEVEALALVAQPDEPQEADAAPSA
jgi:enamine deaminase RidA (YjgF/YER057c/UK114 family)